MEDTGSNPVRGTIFEEVKVNIIDCDNCKFRKYYLEHSRHSPTCENCKIHKQLPKDKQEKIPKWYKGLCEACYNEMTRKDAPMM